MDVHAQLLVRSHSSHIDVRDDGGVGLVLAESDDAAHPVLTGLGNYRGTR